MKRTIQGSLCLMASLPLALTACGKDKPVATLATPAARTNLNFNSTGVDCENLIPLEAPNLTPITRSTDFPKARFMLRGMQMYMINQATQESFGASAGSSDSFAVKLDCNGFRNVQASNYDKDKEQGTFRIADALDLVNKTETGKQRLLKVKFKDGKLIQAESRLVPDTSTNESRQHVGQIPLDPIQVNADMFLTLRFYSPSPSQIEVRMKLEFPADQDGKRMIQYSRAIYDRS